MAKRSILKLVTGSPGEEPNQDGVGEEEEIMAQPEQEIEDWTESEGQLTIDVYQNGDEVVIVSTIAGVVQGDLDITIASDMVTIHGERKRSEEVEAEDYYYQELYWGAFSRSVILPHEIDTEAAKASLKDGILTIRLPKLERTRTKKLKVS